MLQSSGETSIASITKDHNWMRQTYHSSLDSHHWSVQGLWGELAIFGVNKNAIRLLFFCLQTQGLHCSFVHPYFTQSVRVSDLLVLSLAVTARSSSSRGKLFEIEWPLWWCHQSSKLEPRASGNHLSSSGLIVGGCARSTNVEYLGHHSNSFEGTYNRVSKGSRLPYHVSQRLVPRLYKHLATVG